MLPALVNFLLLSTISVLHVYWALGGRWGFDASLPELNGQKVLKPRWFDTLVVAGALAAMGLFHLYKLGWLPGLRAIVPTWLERYGLWLMAVLFSLRAIGEFRYVGFFKRVRNSRFAEFDTRYYSPLCLLLSINTLLLIIAIS
ncbi:DUF3995 domain-containing protein [Spirosoma soli]|uniref:DUF3995 domain-containing protein n=1 Tax=Spirosoma soli TaxID=1770529 RepID=A0ABW5MA76_9BACT